MAKPILLSILTALALFAIFLGVMRTGSASATFVGTVRFKDSTAATATDISLATVGQQVAVHVDDEDLIAPTSSVAVFSTSDPSGLTLTLNKIAEGKYSGLLQIATSTSATSTHPKLKAANGDTVTAVYHDVDPLISTAVIITVGEVAPPPTPTPTPTPAPPPPPPPPPGGGGGGGGDPTPVAEFTVDSTADAVDAAPGDGVCDDGAGNCTLRAAIMEANALAGDDTITLPAGTYTLTLTGASEDNNAAGDLDIKSNVTIDGAAAPTTFINGGGIDRVLHILDGSTVNLNDLTITNGNGGIGGGIFNAGGTLLRVNRSSITGNTANQGAGINAFGSLFLTDSTVSGNTEGGIYVSGGVTVKLANCTISGNTLTRGSGAAIKLTHFGINLSLNNCTITGNTVISGAVGGIYAIVGTVNIKNTIVAGNAGGSKPDVEGTFNSQGYNLVGDGTGSSGFAATGDQVGTAASPIDPKLSPLADNGGPTKTHALLLGSPAIDTGNAATPGSGGNACEATDQRGVGRPQGSTCDIGAFEVEVTPGGLVVNSTADAVDATPGDGVCDDGAGNCTLRAAIMEANALAGADTITLPAGTYTLSIAGTGEEAAATGDLDITDDLTINGAGQGSTIIDGNSLDRVIDVLSGTTVAISGLTVQNGDTDSQDNGVFAGLGGGIFNRGTITVIDSTIGGNTASAETASFGGGIYNRGTITVTESTISNNTADVGGGIMNARTLTITNSTISGNTTAFEGGGIRNGFIAATAEITNSTISDNTARNGGGIMNVGALMLTNTTISGNTAVTSLGGGGIFIFLGVVEHVNTIIAGNSAPVRPDCFGNPTSLGNNLIGNDSGCSFSPATGDLVNVDPKLGPLADNGGPTLTHALLNGSPAIDAVPIADCTDPAGNPITTDQRGIARPQGTNCDIGAFELELVPTQADLSVTKADSPDPVFVGELLTYSLTTANAATSTLAATGVTLTDSLATSTVFVSASAGCVYDAGPHTVACDIGNLGVGALASTTIVVMPTAAGVIINTAEVAGNELDLNPANNTAMATTTVSSPALPAADLSVTKADSPDPVFVGELLTYSLTTANAATSTLAATGVTLTDSLATSTVFVSASAGCVYDAGPHTVTCDIGNLGVSAFASTTIVVMPTAAGVITNTAEVAGNELDLNPANNTATATTIVNSPAADLSVTKADSSDPALVGELLTYRLMVANAATSTLAATGVTLTDSLATSTAFVSASAGCVYDAGPHTVACDIGNLGVGALASTTIVVIPTAVGVITNTAEVAGNELDLNPANNTATEATTVNSPAADLSVAKSDSPDPVFVGELLTYSLTTANAATSTLAATGVTLTDSLATSTAFVSASAGCVYDAGPHTVACDIGNLGVGALASTTIVVMPTAVGVITNTAEVAGNELDLNPANNTATQDTLVVQAPTVNEIVNGDFETGDFQGWTQTNSGSGEFAINDGTFDPPGPDGPLPPLEGNFAAVTSQSGPGWHTLFQDVALSADLTIAVLSWDDRIRNHAGVFSDPNQEFRVEIWNTNNEVLAEIFSTNPGDASLNDRVTRAFDISTFIGQTIRIAFTQEDNLFFFNLHLDNVSLAVSTGVGGDLNGDGDVNVFDAIIDLQIIVGLIEPTQAQMILGDVVRDGTINVFDAILLLQHIVGLTVITHCGPEPATATNTSLAPQQPVPLALDERDSYPIADGS